MKKALVNTQSSVQHISGWTEDNPPNPIYETYPNSCAICEVVDEPFEVYPTLIWVDCDDNVVAYQYWYDSVNQTINPIENAPQPEPTQPESSGTQSL